MSIRSALLAEVKKVFEDVAKELGVEIDRIILFGSRARGDYREDSDWDFLLVTKTRYPREVVREFVLRVRRALVDIGIVAEIIVVDRDTLEQYRNCTGYVYHHALSEGIAL